ncbi:Xaa-Pro aminopeptidase [Gammaproteobacteria bacterium]
MNQKELSRRRRRFLKSLGNHSVAILATNEVHIRSRDTEYPFRPDNDFYYLTGFPEPEAFAVFIPDRPEGEFILFCQKRDPEKEVWTGARIGLEKAKEVYGASETYAIGRLEELIPSLLEGRTRIYCNLGRDTITKVLGWIQQIKKKSRTGIRAPTEIVEIGQILHEHRLIKSSPELKRMRMAAKISADGHMRAMRACRPEMYEYQLEAELSHEFSGAGARANAYASIVAAGKNACILHYTDNNGLIKDGDLVLIDAGCEWDYYAADISRTFPANGKFSKSQRQLYDLVLRAQRAAISEVRPGKRFDEPHEAAIRVLAKGLVELGWLEGKVSDLVKEEKHKRFYMHRTSHWLGMDVHDVGEYKVNEKWREFKPGMVLTVEPGIYVPPESEGVPKEYWGIGIRIEDDCLVTEEDPEVLTKAVPKDPEEIESLMQKLN